MDWANDLGGIEDALLNRQAKLRANLENPSLDRQLIQKELDRVQTRLFVCQLDGANDRVLRQPIHDKRLEASIAAMQSVLASVEEAYGWLNYSSRNRSHAARNQARTALSRVVQIGHVISTDAEFLYDDLPRLQQLCLPVVEAVCINSYVESLLEHVPSMHRVIVMARLVAGVSAQPRPSDAELYEAALLDLRRRTDSQPHGHVFHQFGNDRHNR